MPGLVRALDLSILTMLPVLAMKIALYRVDMILTLLTASTRMMQESLVIQFVSDKLQYCLHQFNYMVIIIMHELFLLHFL